MAAPLPLSLLLLLLAGLTRSQHYDSGSEGSEPWPVQAASPSQNYHPAHVVARDSLLDHRGMPPRDEEDICGHCFFDRCPRPEKCEAGITRDSCGCCFVCAQKEGQMCHPAGAGLGSTLGHGRGSKDGTCGEDLECRLRDDVVTDYMNPLVREGRAVLGEAQYLCYCRHTETLCGSNGKTYDNLCKLMEDAYRDHEKIKVASRGPCQAAPWIHTGLENIYNETGSQVALICEVKGYPIPVVEWSFHGSNGLRLALPSDDNHVAVLARGGPEKYQVTSWLQIQGLLESDDGEYTCLGINKYGNANSTSRLQVFRRGDPRYKRYAEL